MNKKYLSFLILFLFICAYGFAQFKISAGAGGLTGGDYNGGNNFIIDLSQISPDVNFIDYSVSLKNPYFGGGGFIFADFVYAEAAVAFFAGSGDQELIVSMEGESISFKRKYIYTSLNFSLFGKYPFKINEKLSIFPLLGIDYQLILNMKDSSGKKFEGILMPAILQTMLGSGVYFSDGIILSGNPIDFSSLWFKLGGGADFFINNNFFIRFSALYGIRLRNNMERKMADRIELLSLISGYDVKNEFRLGHGLTIKIAAGYKF